MAKVLELTTKNFKDTIEKNDFVIIEMLQRLIKIKAGEMCGDFNCDKSCKEKRLRFCD